MSDCCNGYFAYLAGCSHAERLEAARRLSTVAHVWALEALGRTRSAAVVTAAIDRKVSTSSVWRWLSRIDGCDPQKQVMLLRYLAADRRRAHAG